MSWFSSFIHPDKGYKDAQNVLNNFYQQAQNYQQPYNQFGVNQGINQQKMIDDLMNPQKMQDEWIKGYKESEAAKNMENLAQEHGLNAASSMGLMGSNTALNAIQSGTTGIAAQDRQKYLDDLMEKYKTGAGLSQNMYNQGVNSAGQMGQNAMTQGQNSAQMQFGATNAPGNLFGGLVGAGSKLLMDYLTGGMGVGGYGRGAWSTGGS